MPANSVMMGWKTYCDRSIPCRSSMRTPCPPEGRLMNLKLRLLLTFWICLGLGAAETELRVRADDVQTGVRRLLYVAAPGVRNYLEYGGHGLLVFDIDDGHNFVKRIPLGGLREDGTPDNVKGICASAETGRIYISTISTMTCLDLHSEERLWEQRYEGG